MFTISRCCDPVRFALDNLLLGEGTSSNDLGDDIIMVGLISISVGRSSFKTQIKSSLYASNIAYVRMTRGRKKDLTIPPSRTLAQQRDYRARRANYVVELEERCQRAEAENKQLRKELLAARAGLTVPVLLSPQAVSFNIFHDRIDHNLIK